MLLEPAIWIVTGIWYAINQFICLKKAETFYYPLCDALHDLLTFVQFKKREKHPWKSVTFIYSSMGVFHVFLTCANGTKSSKASHRRHVLTFKCEF